MYEKKRRFILNNDYILSWKAFKECLNNNSVNNKIIKMNDNSNSSIEEYLDLFRLVKIEYKKKCRNNKIKSNVYNNCKATLLLNKLCDSKYRKKRFAKESWNNIKLSKYNFNKNL